MDAQINNVPKLLICGTCGKSGGYIVRAVRVKRGRKETWQGVSDKSQLPEGWQKAGDQYICAGCMKARDGVIIPFGSDGQVTFPKTRLRYEIMGRYYCQECKEFESDGRCGCPGNTARCDPHRPPDSMPCYCWICRKNYFDSKKK